MGASCLDPGTPPDTLLFAVPQDIHDLNARPITAGYEGSARAHLHQHARRFALTILPGHRDGSEDLGLIEIGGHESRLREKSMNHGFDCVAVEQSISARSHHDRIEDIWREEVLSYDVGNALDKLGGRQHAGLDRRRCEIFNDSVDLSLNHIEGYPMHRSHADRILSRDRSYCARAEHTKRVEGLDVRLDARTATAIASCDGESDGLS